MDQLISQEETLAACVWPELDEPYASALREAVAHICSRFVPAGIVAAGSILRGDASPTSDLDIYVIHRGTFRQRVQKYFCGVPAEIFVNPPGTKGVIAERKRKGATDNKLLYSAQRSGSHVLEQVCVTVGSEGSFMPAGEYNKSTEVRATCPQQLQPDKCRE